MASSPFLDEQILSADVLARRPAAPPDYPRESMALDRLIARINAAPQAALAALTDVTMALTRAGSAGISVLEGGAFVWPAISGAWAEHTGDGLPIDASPCGVVIARDRALLFTEPHRVFPNIAVQPHICEILLVPLRFGGRTSATLWAISHDDHRFTSEDARILERLGLFAAAIADTEQARSDRRRDVADERSRFRSTLSTIRSIIRRAAEPREDAPSGDTPIGELGDRVAAFAGGMRMGGDVDTPADLWLLIAEVLTKRGEMPGGRVTLEGPDVNIAAEHSGLFALAMRELLDNALRFGALAAPTGRVAVSWSIEPRGSDAVLILDWREAGVPLDRDAPVTPGFGFDLLREGFPHQIGSEAQIDLTETGLVFTLQHPIAATAAA